MADIGANDNGRSATLGSKTYTAGVFDAADTSLTATDADPCEAIVLFQHTGSDATARLTCAGIASEEAFGLPRIGAALAPRSINSSGTAVGRPRVRRVPTMLQLADEAWLLHG